MGQVNFIGLLGKQQIKRISAKNKRKEIGISIYILLAVHKSRRQFGVVGWVINLRNLPMSFIWVVPKARNMCKIFSLVPSKKPEKTETN